MFLIFRILIGAIFLISGFEKLTSPYQNFLFIIQSYDIVPDNLALITAKVLPWIELLTGLFLIIGLWIKEATFASMLMFAAFITVVGQAMVRKLPIDDCGCFGEMVTLPLYAVFAMDVTLLVFSILLYLNYTKALQFSLDRQFER